MGPIDRDSSWWFSFGSQEYVYFLEVGATGDSKASEAWKAQS